MNYVEKWESIIECLSKKELPIRDTAFDAFCPYVQFVTIDALEPKDWPHNIAENSAYVLIKVDMDAMNVECLSCGHIWLSREDQSKTYLAMCSIKQASKAIGKSWMRKSKFKNEEDLANKVNKFWASVMETLNTVTDGYPYKQMKINIY